MTAKASLPVRERGAVLIVSMVLLVILTLLGVSVMNTTQLEERMASNVQEVTQAFQSAETGLSQAYGTAPTWRLGATLPAQSATDIPGSARADTSDYRVDYVNWSKPPPSLGFDAKDFVAHHWNMRSEGQSQSGFTATVHGGVVQVTPVAGGIIE